ncbi:hypothetical protein HYX15_00980 [Candidatus Woesearchaeota archaeon]|nr:hypothetical protein [Candidatus Woesearchaeota archaeon]
MTRPIQKWRIGNMDLSIWDNKKEFEGGELSYKTFSITKSYKKKKEDIWRSEVINNLRRQDIVRLQLLLNKAQDYLFFEVNKEQEKENTEENEGDE